MIIDSNIKCVLEQEYQKSDCNCKNKLLISIIVVVYNGASTLHSCLKSIAAQTFSNYELILIDGGSEDETKNIILEYSAIISYYISEKDDGIYHAMNKGISVSKGEWLYFLGADDFFYNNETLHKVEKYLNANQINSNIIYGSVIQINSEGDELNLIGENWAKAKKKIYYQMPISHQSIFMNKNWFDKYGVFNSKLKICGDYELLLRGILIENIEFIPNLIVAKVRQGGISSNSLNSFLHLKELKFSRKENKIESIHSQVIFMQFKVIVRLLIQYLFGQTLSRSFIDNLRKCAGKKPYWTKL
jgi:glycosyltransferase involved in cell wall biosynthesis